MRCCCLTFSIVLPPFLGLIFPLLFVCFDSHHLPFPTKAEFECCCLFFVSLSSIYLCACAETKAGRNRVPKGSGNEAKNSRSGSLLPRKTSGDAMEREKNAASLISTVSPGASNVTLYLMSCFVDDSMLAATFFTSIPGTVRTCYIFLSSFFRASP